MKKLLVLVFTLLWFSGKAQVGGVIGQVLQTATQNSKRFDGIPPLKKGDFILNMGTGLPNNIASKLNVPLGGITNDVTTGKIGPIYIGAEMFTTDNMSFGVQYLYAKGARKVTVPIFNTVLFDDQLTLNQLTVFIARHTAVSTKLAWYFKGGVGIGLWKTKNNTKIPEPFNYNGTMGIRYFLTPKLALNGEATYSQINFSGNIGVSFKLNKPKTAEAKK